MKKSLGLLMIAILPMLTAQAKPMTKNDMVGVWQCYTNIDYQSGESLRNQTLDTLKKDGTMSQIWETVYYDKRGSVSSIEYFVINNRWDFKNDEMKIYDWKLVDYQIYDYNKLPLDTQTIKENHESWQKIYDEPYHDKLNFISKNEFIYTSDAGDEVENNKSGCRKKV